MSHISRHLLLQLPNLSDSGQRLRFGNLRGDSVALVISQLVQTYQRPILVVTADNHSACQLQDNLQFFMPTIRILNFPDWETLPYDIFAPHPDLVAQRLTTLAQLPELVQGVLLVSATTLMQRLAPADYVAAHSFSFTQGSALDRDELCSRLERVGYLAVSQVVAAGEFAVRGAILDVFPLGSPVPYRLELGENIIQSIRSFDPNHQRSYGALDQIHLLPAREFPLSEAGLATFRQKWCEVFTEPPRKGSPYHAIDNTVCPPGLEYYLPLFFSSTHLLFDYLPSASLIIQIEAIQQHMDHFWREIDQRYEQRRYDLERPPLPPQYLYLTPDQVSTQLKRFARIVCQTESLAEHGGDYRCPAQDLPDLCVNHRSTQPLAKLQDFLDDLLIKKNGRILFCVEGAGRREVLAELLKPVLPVLQVCADWPAFLTDSAQCAITVAPLTQGLLLTEPVLAVITENQLLGQPILRQSSNFNKGLDKENIIRNLAELNIGAPVVHRDHGVGRYLGLQTLKVIDHEAEFLLLEYADHAKLYVPVSSLYLISRYSSHQNEQAPLHCLGSDQWEKAKRQATQQIRDTAAELLDIYAKRAAQKGYAFKPPDDLYRTFARTFPFQETQDQQQAIAQVIADMCSDHSMDRLICGDVGFGKTEIAMRAAFLAVRSGKQVAVLVPTTLLAQQHYRNFRDRFADWPVSIEMISRFRSSREQKTILDKLQLGQIDIVIGTHTLLGSTIRFKDLGLLVIDEEHRFGVQQKERLKRLRAQVDTLMLTATPIPRTLNMALSDLHALSIIATPPAQRLAIKTFVHERNSHLIREAILRELLRGGQVYFLHNQVETIEKVADELKRLVPEARLGIAHGQLRERELERLMADFYHQRFNVLICTTIIETGLDIPTANTIIIDRADKLGLAQLYQLRGRVGRSHHQAYAYLMTPAAVSLSPDASKRLAALVALEELGAGFTLATHDLEIRGAGQLLGEQQSGNIHNIGFSLYMELLEQTVRALKSGLEPNLALEWVNGTEVNLQLPALIPKDYLDDVSIRLGFYKRIANATTTDQLADLQAELVDRFGLLPEATQNLLKITRLKLAAQQLGIKKIEAGAEGGRLEFNTQTTIDPSILVHLVQTQPQQYRFNGDPVCLCFRWEKKAKPAQRIDQLWALLTYLSDGISGDIPASTIG